MYIANIIFSAKEINEDTLEIIDYLMSELHHKGISITFRNSIYQKNEKLIIPITTPEQTSLSIIKEYRWAKKLLESGVNIQTEILGKDRETDEVCNCNKPSFYILLGTPIIPFYCGDCRNYVPLYRIPFTNKRDNNYSDLNNWNKENLAWSEIEFYSAEETYAHEQLCDITSSHNINAMELCANIENTSLTKCYYYLEELRYVKNSNIAKQKKCPCCGGEWFQKEQFLDTYDFKCEKCQILSTLAYVDS